MLKPIRREGWRRSFEILRRSWTGSLKEFNSKEMVQERMEKSEFLFPLLLDGYQSNPSEEEMEGTQTGGSFLRTDRRRRHGDVPIRSAGDEHFRRRAGSDEQEQVCRRSIQF